MDEVFFTKDVIMSPDGKPVFVGKERQIPSNESHKSEGSKMQCPVCTQMVDYLVGDNTPDGGRQGCESCWRPGTGKIERNENKVEEVIG